jgi:NAD(P)-dependent dehydrogenase (short-subunit alcohol dehydrogenase family)
MQIDFAARHVVVTGGTGALGAAVVERLVAAGATCHVPAHRAPDPAKFSLAANERVRITPGVDLANEAAVTAFYGSLPSLWGSIHCAGAFDMAPIAETSLQAFREMFDVNAVTCFLCSREAVRRIRATSANDGGRIVNVGSKPALVPTGGMTGYATAKAAVHALTVSLSEELAAERIWVNAVIPSTMDTPANRKAMPNADFEKWPKVSEVAATIAFLASPQNAVTRGALVPVYGRS